MFDKINGFFSDRYQRNRRSTMLGGITIAAGILLLFLVPGAVLITAIGVITVLCGIYLAFVQQDRI